MVILTDENYVDKAEEVMKNRENFSKLTTSKIRNLLKLTSTLYDESNVKEYSELKDKIAYLRVQFVYQAGRDDAVKRLVEKATILEALKEIQEKDSLQRFCRYMEALVAYFKFYGGKD
ncbi:MAG: type III-A CRISPR-associated protein Csm2 [Streptococcus sp.]|nr:type III-A CRISPR-associated protein Csm2 [Streptococcus sp.]